MNDPNQQSERTQQPEGSYPESDSQPTAQELVDTFAEAIQNIQPAQNDIPTANPAVLDAYQDLVDALAGPREPGSPQLLAVPPPAEWNVSAFDFVNPTVESIEPAPNSTGINLKPDVVANFSERMEVTSLQAVDLTKPSDPGVSAIFTLTEMNSLEPVAAKVKYEDVDSLSKGKATLRPD